MTDSEPCPRCGWSATDASPLPAGSGTMTISPPSPTPAGVPERIGRFEVKRLLGEGAFGRVYEAFDPVMKRRVALKVAKHLDEKHGERFMREARSAGLLTHPNIVAVFDSGADGESRYIASAFVEGKTLDGKMEPRRAAEIVRKLAEALAYAHKMGVVHRDVKPANVMLREDGEPLLMDFGLAARADEAAMTVEGQVLGTPAYIAPEQWKGHATAASDQYALGCVLFQLLVGETPFSGSDVGHWLVVHLQAPVPAMPGVPRDLDSIVRKCLEKEAGRRYGGCVELAEDLGKWLKGEATKARPVGPLGRLSRWAARQPALAASLAAVFVLLVAGVSLVAWQWRRAVAALARADREQKDRALAQLGALQDAAPAAVPGILGTLQDNEDVLPRLRELHEAEGDRARRMRLALALLPHEDSLRDGLAAWMLEAEDPAEVLLVRDRLLPHAAGLREGLWKKPGLRARAALALFDPDSPRWKDEAAAVLDEALKENPLHLGAWVRGLSPVKAAMLAPLGKVFREPGGERRRTAALVLKDYAADDADALADLLLDADPAQYAVLKFALDKHRERMLARMREEVKRVPDWWKDAPHSWPAPQREEIERAGGLVAERFALCPSLPME
ncbi:MAG: serine/threonine protein kinase, partial [Gemmataceae bacterium]|nr:serine/threonine protein kinase [Gemmataceae bacterium]